MLGTKNLHKENIIQRDLNPANILIIEKLPGVLVFKICDLGVSELFNPVFKLLIEGKIIRDYSESK